MAMAVGAMLLVATVNILGTKVGGGVQVVGTVIKVGALVAMIVLPFVLGRVHPEYLTPVRPKAVDGAFWAAFATAMVSILWAYDGWVNTTALAEEVREPQRNLPRVMGFGVLLLIALYLAMTVVYHLVLPMDRIASAATKKGSPEVVAAVFCRTLFGPMGQAAIASLVMISTLISLNGNALSGPRAYFALARDGLFPAALRRIHPRYQTPAVAIGAQAGWAIALTVIGTFLTATPPPASGLPEWLESSWAKLHAEPLYDVMYNYVIFGGTLIYLLTITSIFVLRARHPEWERPYRTWGYPVTPLVFIASALLLLGSSLWINWFQSVAGLVVIGAGIPAYALMDRRRGREVSEGVGS
jgi:APA family basic amino acid/polyamine antiporter